MFRILLFGSARFFVGDDPYRWSARPMVLPLLAYLILHRDAPQERTALAFTLWPDDDEAHARGNLRRHIHYLQEALPAAPAGIPWLLADAMTLHWNPDAPVSIDVHEFDRMRADRGRRAEAADLYAGDLLASLQDEWLIAPRQRYSTAYHDLLADLVEQERARHDVPKAMDYARRLLGQDPWREDALRHLMALKVEAGDRAGAVAEYERFSTALKSELDVEPMDETTAIFKSIARGESPAGPGRDASAIDLQADDVHAEQTPFFGRDDELAALKAAWEHAARGTGSLVLIGGEAGIGKSRLIREAALLVTRQRGRVFSGGTSNPEAAPYQALAEALADATSLVQRLRLEPVWLDMLAAIVPAIASHKDIRDPTAPGDAARERMRLFEAIVAFWQAVARLAPCCIVLEDLHWTGPDTVDAIAHLARRLRETPVLLIASYRDDELSRDHPLRAFRRSAREDGRGSHIALRRLSRLAVQELARAHAGPAYVPEIASRVFERSDGNPLFALSLLETYEDARRRRESQVAADRDFAADDLSPGIRQAVAARLAGISDAARFVAETASVVGKSFDVELLQEVTGNAEHELLDALGELLDRRIMAEAVSGAHWRYEFANDLLQSVAYESMASARCIARNRRVAHVMETLYASRAEEMADRVALHWDRGDEAALAAPWYIRAANRAARAYANREALARLSRALELTADPKQRFDALLLREQIADRLGDRESQRRDLDELERLARAQCDAGSKAEVLYRRVCLAASLADRSDHASLAAQLLEMASLDGLTHWRAPALISIAGMASSSGDYDGARRTLRPLLQSSEHLPWFFEAWRMMADIAIFEGKFDEAQSALARARERDENQTDLSAIARTALGMARAALAKQDYALMLTSAEEALRIARTIGDRVAEALALHTMANGAVYPFRIADARRWYDEAASLYDAMDHRVGQAGLLVDKGLFQTELGLFDAAALSYARAEALATAIDYNWVRCVVAVNSGYCARLRGDAAASKASAERAVHLAGELKSRHLLAAALGTLGAAELMLGESAAAIEHLEEGVRLRRPDGATPRLGDNLGHLAVAYAHAGRIEEARAAAEEVVALYDQAPQLPPQPTEWLWNAAQAFRAAGDHARVKSLLNRAAAVARKRASLLADDADRRAFLALPFNRSVRSETRRKR